MSISRRMFAKAGSAILAGLALGVPAPLQSKTHPDSAMDVQLFPVKRSDGFWIFLPNVTPTAAVRRDTTSGFLVFDTTTTVGLAVTRLASGYVVFR